MKITVTKEFELSYEELQEAVSLWLLNEGMIGLIGEKEENGELLVRGVGVFRGSLVYQHTTYRII